MKNYFLAGFILLLTGCDLFDTRDAQKPDQGPSTFEQAITPKVLISNLENSFKDKNVENYLACFVDSSFTLKKFLFLPTSSAVSQFPILSENWTKKDEESYFNNMKTRINENSTITLSLFNQVENPLGDSLQFTANYLLQIPNSSGIPENYQGDLIFNMIRDSRSVWVIYYWQDIKTATDLPGWSELKGLLSN